MKTIKELEKNKKIPHREKVIIDMWLNAYKEEILGIIDKLVVSENIFGVDFHCKKMVGEKLKSKIEGKWK